MQRHQPIACRIKGGLQRNSGHVERPGHVVVAHRRVDVGDREVNDHKLGRDLQRHVGRNQSVVVKAGPVHDVG